MARPRCNASLALRKGVRRLGSGPIWTYLNAYHRLSQSRVYYKGHEVRWNAHARTNVMVNAQSTYQQEVLDGVQSPRQEVRVQVLQSGTIVAFGMLGVGAMLVWKHRRDGADHVRPKEIGCNRPSRFSQSRKDALMKVPNLSSQQERTLYMRPP